MSSVFMENTSLYNVVATWSFLNSKWKVVEFLSLLLETIKSKVSFLGYL